MWLQLSGMPRTALPPLQKNWQLVCETEIQDYYDGYGEKVEVNVTQYDKIMVDGRPGLWIMYNFDFRGEHFETLLVILYNGTESHSVTFLQGPGTDHMEEFIETANTIGFSKIEE